MAKFKRQPDSEFDKVARKVRRRDKYTCQMCGAKRCRMNVHHIQRYADCPSLRNDPYNLILLCWECHRDIRNKEKHFAEYLTGIAYTNEQKYNNNTG